MSGFSWPPTPRSENKPSSSGQEPPTLEPKADGPLCVVPWPRPRLDFTRAYEPLDSYQKPWRQKQKPERNYPYVIQDSIESILKPDVIRKLMKCSCCSRIPTPNAFICTEGHLICPTCVQTVGSCPQEIKKDEEENPFAMYRTGYESCCRPITNARNQLFTHIYNNSLFNCSNTGCTIKYLGTDTYNHGRDCYFSPLVKCQGREECRQRDVLYFVYPQHLEKYHAFEIIKDGRQSFLWDYNPTLWAKEFQIMQLFQHCDVFFSLGVEIRGDMLYAILSHFTPIEEDKEIFIGYVQITGPSFRSQLCTGKIFGYRHRSEAMVRNRCLAIPMVTVETLVNNVNGPPTLLVDIFIHGLERCPQAMNWSSTLVTKIEVDPSKSLDGFNVSETIAKEVDGYLKQNPTATPVELFQEGYKVYQEVHDEHRRSSEQSN